MMGKFLFVEACSSLQNAVPSVLDFRLVSRALMEHIFCDEEDQREILRIQSSQNFQLTAHRLADSVFRKDKTVYIVTGAVGSGKSVFVRELYQRDIIPVGVEFVCEDLYKYNYFFNVKPLKNAYIKAKQFFNYKIAKKIARGEDFSMEIVPSASYRLKIVERLRALGYHVCLFHLMTKDAMINVERVHKRMTEGGDCVGTDKVISRYHIVNENMNFLFGCVDEIYIFDFSDKNSALVAYGNSETLKVVTQCNYAIEALLNHTHINLMNDW